LAAHPFAVVARRFAESLAEGPAESLVIQEAAFERDIEQVRLVREQAERATLQSETPHVGLGSFSDGRLEHALKVERRESRFPAQGGKTEVPFEVGLDVDQ
jgi:hypothetical protein